MRFYLVFISLFILNSPLWANDGVIRGRGLGIPFDGDTGALNAITDVAGVEVGHATLIADKPSPGGGQVNIRTGVTVIFPLGRNTDARVPAGWFSFNGNGEMTGTAWIDESGFLEGPVALTNTHSAGIVRDALIEWGQKKFPGTESYSLPVVAETWDGFLNDINGFHVKKEDVFQAIENAAAGRVGEGNAGGGTGMMAYRFKGGIGTASRKAEGYTVGVLVQANYGKREQLIIAGVPVGREITGTLPQKDSVRDGSIIVVVATDAPLLSHQLRRLAKRAALGIGRLGGVAANSSGDLFIAFSTSIPVNDSNGLETWRSISNPGLDPLITATVQATEEAVVNALVAAKTMTGNGYTVYAIPHDTLKSVLKKYNRLLTD